MPAPPGATTTAARVGAPAGAKATTSPSDRPPGIGDVPVLANASARRRPSALAEPYSTAPRIPSRSSARVPAGRATASGPTPATRATARSSARGAVGGPASPTTAEAQGVVSAIASSPTRRRTSLSAARGSRRASSTKKSLQE